MICCATKLSFDVKAQYEELEHAALRCRDNSHLVFVFPQRYGLWDQEGPLEENTASHVDKEQPGREKEEAGRGSDENIFQSGVENKDTNESDWTDQQGPALVQPEKACAVFLKVIQDGGDSERLLYCKLS